MQTHAPPPPPRKSSAGVLFTVLLLVGLFFMLGLLFVVGGVFVFARAETRQAQAMAQHEMARSMAERLKAEQLQVQAEVQRRQAEATAQFDRVVEPPQVIESPKMDRVKEPIRVANREITLRLDEQGKIHLDDKPVELKQLNTLLRDAGKGRESALSVTIEANKKCLFEHVAAVLSVCQDLDIPNVSITTAD